jgi:hypothetical protein
MSAKTEVLQQLAERMRAMETAAQRRAAPPVSLPLLDALLQGSEHNRILVELVAGADGAGAWTLALLLARQACGTRQALVLIDPRGWFYPPAAAALGVDLERVILVRPTSGPQCQAALDQALRCRAVAAVVSWCDRLRPAEGQRLRLAAEAGGGLGLLLRPASALRSAALADLRLVVAPVLSMKSARRLKVEVARWRGGQEGRAFLVELDDETNDVRVFPELASAAARSRTTRPAS